MAFNTKCFFFPKITEFFFVPKLSKSSLATTVTMYGCVLKQQYRVTEVYKTSSHTTNSLKHMKCAQMGMDGLRIEGNPSLLGKFTACLTSVISRTNIPTPGSSRERLYSTGDVSGILSKSLWKTMSTIFYKGSDTVRHYSIF